MGGTRRSRIWEMAGIAAMIALASATCREDPAEADASVRGAGAGAEQGARTRGAGPARPWRAGATRPEAAAVAPGGPADGVARVARAHAPATPYVAGDGAPARSPAADDASARARAARSEGPGVSIEALDVQRLATPLLRRGDLLLAIDGEPVESRDALERRLRALAPSAMVTLLLRRQDGTVERALIQTPDGPLAMAP